MKEFYIGTDEGARKPESEFLAAGWVKITFTLRQNEQNFVYGGRDSASYYAGQSAGERSYMLSPEAFARMPKEVKYEIEECDLTELEFDRQSRWVWWRQNGLKRGDFAREYKE